MVTQVKTKVQDKGKARRRAVRGAWGQAEDPGGGGKRPMGKARRAACEVASAWESQRTEWR